MRVQVSVADGEESRAVNKDVQSILSRRVIEFEAGETRTVDLPMVSTERRLVWLESSFNPDEAQVTEASVLNNGSEESFSVSLVPNVGVGFPVTTEDSIGITNNSSDDGFLTMIVLDDD